MRKWISIIAPIALLVSAAMAQEAGAQAQGTAAGRASANSGAASSSLDAGTAVDASLTKSVDAKKAKPGDAVEARVNKDVKSAGRVVVPKGSKLLGHVTQAQARAKGNAQSELGIAFDRAVLRNGESLAFRGVIRSVASAPQITSDAQDEGMASAGSSNYPTSGSGRGGMLGSTAGSALGGAGSAVGSTAGAVRGLGSEAGTVAGNASAAGSNLGATTAGAVNANARGISGLPGVQIDAGASSSTNGTIFVSNTRNVHFDSGTQLVVQVTSQ